MAAPLIAALAPALLLAQGVAHQHPAPTASPPRAPGYSALGFAPPTPGTYELPPLGAAADGDVLNSDGRRTRLHALYGDKTVLLSFVYTSCGDVNGCPLASFVLAQVQRRALADPKLRDVVRLISLSFDPLRDTPQVLRDYARSFVKTPFDWRFLTCESEAQLAPILANYGQAVIADYDSQGRKLGTYSHMLRVYLIDRDKRIRNIYSPSYLHAEILISDLRTVTATPVDQKPMAARP